MPLFGSKWRIGKIEKIFFKYKLKKIKKNLIEYKIMYIFATRENFS